MPWSEWITSTYTLTPQFRRFMRPVGFDFTNADSLFGSNLSFGEPNDAYAQVVPDGVNFQAIQFVAPDTWSTTRSTFPPELGDLEFGVDYDYKPGANPSDPYKRVDYDPDDSSHIIGWTFSDPTELVGRSDQAADGELWLNPHTSYTTGTNVGAYPMPTPIVWETVPAVAVVGQLFDPPPDPGSTESFSVGIYTPTPYEGPELSSLGVRLGNPFLTYTQPRWRYWIPKRLPLQQVQRNDGLALRGAPSWRQRRSRQSTNSWRANL